MNILFISHRIPYPPNKGDKIRSYNILKYLAEKHTVYLACLIDADEDLENIAPLKSLVKELYWEKIAPLPKKAQSCLSLFGSNPLSVPYFYTNTLQHQIDILLDNVQMDAVFCFSSPTAEYLFRSRHYQGSLQQVTRCMDLIDMDSDKWRQYAESSCWPMKWIYQREAETLLVYEKRISREFNTVLLVTRAERDFFKTHVRADNVIALSNGVDLVHFHPEFTSSLQKDGPSLVFTGAMDYRPNADAVQWFALQVLPAIQEEIPGVHFYIVGSRPSPAVKGLERHKGVHVVGYVKDVREYLSMADVCVIPLRITRGLQNKVLEAMAMGRPVVSTSYAFEGIDATPGEHLMIADDPGTFVQKVIELLTDHKKASLLGAHARQCVEEKYTWQQNLSVLDALFQPSEKEL